MAITHVNTQFGTPNNGGSPTLSSTSVVTKPTGLAAGDVMIAVVNANILGITAPSQGSGAGNWTMLSRVQGTVSGSPWRSEIWYAVAASADVSATSFTWNNADNQSPMWASISAFRGVDQNNPINVFSAPAAGGTTTAVSTPSVTTTTSAWILHIRTVRTLSATTNTFTGGAATSRFNQGNRSTVGYWGFLTDANGETAAGSISGVSTTSPNAPSDSVVATVALQTADISVTAGVATATAAANAEGMGLSPATATATGTAYDTTVIAGTVAPAGVATATAAANDVGMSNAVRGTEVATATAAAYNPGVYYGAPPGRTVIVGAESHTYTPPAESRTYTVTIAGND